MVSNLVFMFVVTVMVYRGLQLLLLGMMVLLAMNLCQPFLLIMMLLMLLLLLLLLLLMMVMVSMLAATCRCRHA